MTNTQRDAMQQALEALVQADSRDGMYSYADEIAALSQALAAPQPAKCWKCGDTDAAFQAVCDVPSCGMREALAAANSPESGGIRTVAQQATLVKCTYGDGGRACCEGGPCRAEEQNNAALTAPQPAQQEPIAYLYHDASNAHNANPLIHSTLLVLATERRPNCRNETPLCTAPQPPAEVPLLTDGNISWLWSEAHNDTTDRMPFQAFARAIEQAVRQKAGIK